MKFFVQTVKGKVTHDFTFEMDRAKEFYDWLNREEMIIMHGDYIPLDMRSPGDWVPVGTVEFVSEYLKKFHPEAEHALKPLNVPKVLYDSGFAMRHIEYVANEAQMAGFDGSKLHVKSMSTLKHPMNGLIDIPKKEDYGEYVGFQVSEEIEIDSEWRVFVFRDEIQHVANYSGDCTIMPNMGLVKKMVEYYASEAPVAYTLDVGVNYQGTFIIECHRFFSCGLYGYSDHKRIPKMLSQEWFEMKNLR